MFIPELFWCSHCEQKFYDIPDLCKHFKTFHKGYFQKFRCPYQGCIQQIFSNRSSFSNHIKNQHSERIPKIAVSSLNNFQCTDFIYNEQPENINENSNNIKDKERIEISTNVLLAPSSGKDIISQENHILEDFKNKILKFVLNLYSNPKLPLSGAESIISDIQELVVEPVISIFQKDNISSPENLLYIKKELGKYSTETKLTKVLMEKGLYKKPKAELINEYSGEIMRKGKTVIDRIRDYAVSNDIGFQLKSFLEIPGIYDIIREFTASEKESKAFSSYINCEHWSQKEEEGKEILALNLFYDDFGTNNPLGSNANTNSLCAFYFSLPNLPPFLEARLNNIFLALLVDVSILNSEDNIDTCSMILNKTFNFLSKTGIKINLNNQEKHIFFKIGVHKGDNLALNKVLGFSPTFVSNYFCRFCKIHKKQAMRKCDLKGIELRNKENYEFDLENRTFKESGIKFRTKFVDLDSFHPTDNPFADRMHDHDEGVLIMDLEQILFYFIVTKKYFTLQRLNYLKKHFNYGELQVGNKSGPLKFIYKVRKDKSTRVIKLCGSASENRCFLRHLPIMINKYVPKNDKVWKFLIQLVKLTDLLDLSRYSDSNLKDLEKTIRDHHSTFLKLFPKQHLRPKYHFLLHYPELIRKMGPPKYNNNYIFEHKNKVLKTIAKNTTSRKFLPMTVSKKIALDTAKRSFLKINPKEIYFSKIKISSFKQQVIRRDLYKTTLLAAKIDFQNVEFLDKVSFREHMYKPTFYIYENLKYLKIKAIFKFSGKYYFILEEFKTLYSPSTTFHILKSSKNKLEIFDMSKLTSFPVNSHLNNKFQYIKKKMF